MPTVAVGVLENDNAIVQARLLVRIILRLRHPQPPAVIEAKPNRLRDSWLARKERHVKPFGTCIVRAASTGGNGFSTTGWLGFTAANRTVTPLHNTAATAKRICISEA